MSDDFTKSLIETLSKALERFESFDFRLRAWLKQRHDDRTKAGAPTIDQNFDLYGQFYKPKEDVDTSKMSPVDKLKYEVNARDK